MKRSDALPSASRSLQAEVGVTDFSGVPAYNPFMGRSGREQLRQKQDSSSNCFHVTINNLPCTRLANHPHGGYLHIQNRSGAVEFPIRRPYQRGSLFRKSRAKQSKGIARIGKGHRLHQLGTVLPETHPGSPSGYLHHSGNLENTSHD